MGTEICYNWEQSYECDDENCENEIDIEYTIYEYPSGHLNTDELNVKNGIEVTRFEYEFNH